MTSALITANTAGNAGGLYDYGPSTLFAHRTIVSQNVGNPTGFTCVSTASSQFSVTSDPECT